MKEHPEKDWKDVNLLSDLPRKPFGWFKPPWARYGHDYDGRIEWWADYRYKDYYLRTGRWRFANWPSCEEYDPFYYDPPVPDGQSKIGFDGRDETYETPAHFAYRDGSKSGVASKWHEYILKHSSQYKDIAKQWNISEQHPGLYVQSSIGVSDYQFLRSEPGLQNTWIAWWKSLQPRFWDYPLNQDCFGKGLFGLKVGVSAGLILSAQTSFWWDKIQYISIPNYWRRFKQFGPKTVPISVAFCTTVCLAAQYRDKDDMWNWTIASWAAGFTQATMFGRMSVMLKFAIPLNIISCAYLVFRTSASGLHPNAQYYENYFSGPLGYLNPILPSENDAYQLSDDAITIIPDRASSV